VSDSQHISEQTVVKSTARIDWRKLFVPFLFIMVLPTLTAFWLDRWLGTLPYITIVAIVICFPAATILVTRIALQEMDRVIAEVTPPAQDEALLEANREVAFAAEVPVETEPGAKSSTSS
jgi:F0F1-type ATP synthase assembly protein I